MNTQETKPLPKLPELDSQADIYTVSEAAVAYAQENNVVITMAFKGTEIEVNKDMKPSEAMAQWERTYNAELKAESPSASSPDNPYRAPECFS